MLELAITFLSLIGGGSLFWRWKGIYNDSRKDLIEALWLPPSVKTDARILTYKNLSDKELIIRAERKLYDDYVDDILQLQNEKRNDLVMMVHDERRAVEAIFRCLERFRQVKHFWFYRPKEYRVEQVFSKKDYRPTDD